MMRAVQMRTTAVAFGMRTLAVALVLAPAGAARAQMDLDGGFGGLGGFVTPAALQTLLIYQLYGLQQQQFDALPEAQRTAMQSEMAKRAADYFTHGAEMTTVPSSGPAAAYFTNGAEVTAANTADTVPYGLPPPEVVVDASAAAAAAPSSQPAVDAAAPAPAAVAAPRPRAVVDAGDAAPSPAESTTTTAWATPAATAEEGGTGPSGAPANVTIRQPTEDQGILGSTSWLAPVYAHLNFRWVWPAMGGLSLGAFALFLALRSR
jgi:hypothetical protein